MLWKTNSRYYRVESYRDLLGQLVVAVAHGGLQNNLGALHVTPVANERERDELVQQLAARRAKRRYRLIS